MGVLFFCVVGVICMTGEPVIDVAVIVFLCVCLTVEGKIKRLVLFGFFCVRCLRVFAFIFIILLRKGFGVFSNLEFNVKLVTYVVLLQFYIVGLCVCV